MMPKKETKEEMKQAKKEAKETLKDIKDKTKEELEKLKAEVEHWKNEYYRAYADTKNLRSNLEKDYRESLKYRAEGFIEGLLPILDSFHSVLANEPTDPALKNYLIGFQYVYRNMVSVLENEGVSEIAPKEGDKFDAKTMNAVDTVEGEKENVITKVHSNGYKLHDRLIRPANVTVTVLPKQNEEPKTENNENKADA